MLVLGLYILIIFWIRHFKRWMGALLHRYEANKKCICACHCVVCGEALFLWDCEGRRRFDVSDVEGRGICCDEDNG